MNVGYMISGRFGIYRQNQLGSESIRKLSVKTEMYLGGVSPEVVSVNIENNKIGKLLIRLQYKGIGEIVILGKSDSIARKFRQNIRTAALLKRLLIRLLRG